MQKDNEKKPKDQDLAPEHEASGEHEEACETDAPAEETAEAAAPAEDLQAKYDALCEKHLRLMAEYDNFRKRSQKERDDIYPNATAKAVEKFLPVLDNLERAAAFPHGDDEFGKGFDMIYQSFQEVLASMGVEAMGEAGEDFDADIHHAVMHIEDEELGENVVAQVLQKGYRIGEKVIRYAMVQTAN